MGWAAGGGGGRWWEGGVGGGWEVGGVWWAVMWEVGEGGGSIRSSIQFDAGVCGRLAWPEFGQVRFVVKMPRVRFSLARSCRHALVQQSFTMSLFSSASGAVVCQTVVSLK